MLAWKTRRDLVLRAALSPLRTPGEPNPIEEVSRVAIAISGLELTADAIQRPEDPYGVLPKVAKVCWDAYDPMLDVPSQYRYEFTRQLFNHAATAIMGDNLATSTISTLDDHITHQYYPLRQPQLVRRVQWGPEGARFQRLMGRYTSTMVLLRPLHEEALNQAIATEFD